MRKRLPAVKFMGFDQLLRIRENNYQGDPQKGYGFDYGILQDEVDSRYYELKERRVEKEISKQLEAMEAFENVVNNIK